MLVTTIAAGLGLVHTALAYQLQSPLPENGHSFGAWAGSDSEAPKYRSELLELHKSLVSTPSISGQEGEIGHVLEDYLLSKGYKTELQYVAARDNTPENKARFNVVAWHGIGRPHAKVLVTSHIDVVPPHIPYEIESGDVSKETMIKGRGSVDAKGSVAAMIVAVEELLATSHITREDTMFLFVVGEEVAGDGMRRFSEFLETLDAGEKPTFDAVIFGEPTENKLACGHKGGLFCDVKAEGVPGHSGYPWLGKSANEVMVRALSKIIDTDLGSSERFGNTTVNIGSFQGGVAANVIAESAVVKLAVRVAIGPEEEGGKIVRERIRDILDEVDEEALSIDCGGKGYGFVECDCDVEGFEDIVVNYGTDIPNLKGDHTRYLYGPGNILVAHGARENLTVGDLETSVKGYQRLILHALGKDTKDATPGEL